MAQHRWTWKTPYKIKEASSEMTVHFSRYADIQTQREWWSRCMDGELVDCDSAI